jgi:hypothetical protein
LQEGSMSGTMSAQLVNWKRHAHSSHNGNV